MKTDKIVIGTVLIILGILFLFASLNILSWQFVLGLWKLWPLILVLWGLDMIIKESHFLKTVLFLLLILLSFLVYFYAEKGKMLPNSFGEDQSWLPYHSKTYKC